jgi:mRNA interferase RelE/StbE
MARKLSLTNDAQKFLDRLDAKQYRQVVRRILALTSDATPSDSIKMTGSEHHRVDQGEYRIVYFFDTDTVYIVVVGKRNDDDVYARMRRK